MNRALDVMTLILNPSFDHKRIKRALVTLEFERNLALQDDEEREVSLRDAIYGLVQCLHLTLQELTKIKDQPEIAEEVPMDIHEFSGQSNDVIFIVISQALDVMNNILKPESDLKNIEASLVSLEFERIQSLEEDEEREIPLRDSIYGLIQSIHLTLQELTKIKDQPEVANEKPENLIMTKEECRDAALASINNRSIHQPIDINTPHSDSIPEFFKVFLKHVIDPVVKEEEDPFGVINDILNYPANEIKNEETEFIPEGGENDVQVR
ncbi:hypothetical protein PFISCL1PPCAC_21772 [Pristionchus fissidentatus]|uniref:Uncharacterized protein n=1 Tax=Pristionchus fissidentatus TaxID=1538716 RepID=A0AAV5WKS8_9BILA|nr:hypothetical protein PFISCL1PPCAC_21772 [Pristionchus fissidentatus]